MSYRDDPEDIDEYIRVGEYLSNAIETEILNEEQLEYIQKYNKTLQLLKNEQKELLKIRNKLSKLYRDTSAINTAEIANVEETAQDITTLIWHYRNYLDRLDTKHIMSQVIERESIKAYYKETEKEYGEFLNYHEEKKQETLKQSNEQSHEPIQNKAPSEEKPKENTKIISKRISAVISLLLCITLYLIFLTTVFTNERDTYICYTTKTGECFHSAVCQYISKSAYETTVYEASKKYRPCNHCNPCVKNYETTITERNYFIPLLISAPISTSVFFLLTYKKKDT
jgi:hypothetical protein